MRMPSMNSEVETQYKELLERDKEEIVIEGEKMEALSLTPGWKLIEQDLYLRLESYGTTLISSKDPVEIHRLQGAMSEIKKILAFVADGIQAKKDAQMEKE